MNDEVDLRKYLDVLVRRKWVVLAVFLAVGLAGSLLSIFVFPPIYEANLLLSPGYINPASNSHDPYGESHGLVKILQSDAIAHDVIEHLGLAKEAAGLHVSARSEPDTWLVRIIVRARTPGVARRVVEALVASVVQSSNEAAEVRRRIIGRSLDQLRAEESRAALAAAEAGRLLTRQGQNSASGEHNTTALTLEALAAAERTRATLLDRQGALSNDLALIEPVKVAGGIGAVEVRIVPRIRLDILVASVLGLMAGVIVALALESLPVEAHNPAVSAR